ncbi:hypothetical protein IFM89_029507 [Coptis chinensis]|uniref:Alpha-(1,6)-fucosyltransferase n=1 Tax=Coptis chinensis TaxID=261450 RepID=A0A835LSV4_9MAGN|nr:hypothetical protein IFM89_029507 [Coptis chinensis]
MEQTTQKTLERVVSLKALQMGSSFPCQICVVGFLCGVCLTSFFLAALTSFSALELGGFAFSSLSLGTLPQNSSPGTTYIGTSGEQIPLVRETERKMSSQHNNRHHEDERASLLYSAWGALLNNSAHEDEVLLSTVRLRKSIVPKAPHLENCKFTARINEFLDNRREDQTSPSWTTWKGSLGLELLHHWSTLDKQLQNAEHQRNSEGAYAPWIVGSDEDNFPLTRKVQQDLWVNQHPLNCHDANVRFLVADWEKLPGFGPLRSRWSCYFFPETSKECQDRASELMQNKEAWEDGIVTGKDNYTSKEIWAGRIPRIWGEPWSCLQPTTEINGSLVRNHRKMDRRWWRAQAVRYLMRFQSKYTCDLLNIARHNAFGMHAAKMVLQNLSQQWPKVAGDNPQSDIERIVWSDHKPWVPRPILSMHVRMGDKACEMKVIEFEEYMRLADRIRKRFPSLNSIWLSTEMQEVIDKTISYTHWNFYYTNVTRQVGNITMASYEASLGRETSTNYPLVNFLMASEADYFIGALGSTWCFLIDGMRNTGGKVMAGYLSVNKDRFWQHMEKIFLSQIVLGGQQAAEMAPRCMTPYSRHSYKMLMLKGPLRRDGREDDTIPQWSFLLVYKNARLENKLQMVALWVHIYVWEDMTYPTGGSKESNEALYPLKYFSKNREKCRTYCKLK